MKIALFMIMCSALANECMPPHKLGQYDTLYECLNAGYTESLKNPMCVFYVEIQIHPLFCFEISPQKKEENISKVLKTNFKNIKQL